MHVGEHWQHLGEAQNRVGPPVQQHHGRAVRLGRALVHRPDRYFLPLAQRPGQRPDPRLDVPPVVVLGPGAEQGVEVVRADAERPVVRARQADAIHVADARADPPRRRPEPLVERILMLPCAAPVELEYSGNLILLAHPGGTSSRPTISDRRRSAPAQRCAIGEKTILLRHCTGSSHREVASSMPATRESTRHDVRGGGSTRTAIRPRQSAAKTAAATSLGWVISAMCPPGTETGSIPARRANVTPGSGSPPTVSSSAKM